jgi:hypothetical protein
MFRVDRDSDEGKHDRLGLSAFLLKTILIFSSLVLLLLVSGSVLRTPVDMQAGAALFRKLGLSAPALIRSGREARNPDGMDRRVDLRISPLFPLPDPDPAGLIFGGPGKNGISEW